MRKNLCLLLVSLWLVIPGTLVATATTAAGSDYSASIANDGPLQVVTLEDRGRQMVVRIGVNIGNRAFEFSVKGQNVLWTPPYQKPSDLKAATFFGVPVLSPFANRLNEDAFYANGKKYLLNDNLGNIRRDGDKNKLAIHGMVHSHAGWQVVSMQADENSAEVVSRLEFWKFPELMAQFPFAHTMEMHYRLENGTLEVETAITNLASEDLPLAIGFHPYYRVFDAPRDDWSLTIPARTQMVLDDKNLPTGERRPNPVAPGSALKTLKLDDVFVDLMRDGNGWATFELKGKSQKVKVAMGPAFRAGVVFTPMDGGDQWLQPGAAWVVS
jgi:aldose 1-epimerase